MNEFRWDATVGQYRYPNGRFVPRSVVREAMDRAYAKEHRKIRALALELRNGDVSLMVWRQEMRDAISNLHLYSAAVARGGWAQLTQSDFGRIGALIKSEYQFLENFAQEIANGFALDGWFVTRAQMYADAGRESYHKIETVAMKDSGYKYESNVLHPAEHCEGANSCVGETERGRVKIGQLIPIGQRRCMRNCHCSKEYYRSLTD